MTYIDPDILKHSEQYSTAEPEPKHEQQTVHPFKSFCIERYTNEQIEAWKADRARYGMGLDKLAERCGVCAATLERIIRKAHNERLLTLDDLFGNNGRFAMLPHVQAFVYHLVRQRRDRTRAHRAASAAKARAICATYRNARKSSKTIAQPPVQTPPQPNTNPSWLGSMFGGKE